MTVLKERKENRFFYQSILYLFRIDEFNLISKMSEVEISKSKSKVSMTMVKSQSQMKSMARLGGRSMSRLRVRRPSFGFTGVPGIKPVERTSQVYYIIFSSFCLSSCKTQCFVCVY